MSRLQPDYYIPHITGVTLEFLRRHGIRGLILDVDNTLTTHDDPTPSGCGPLRRSWDCPMWRTAKSPAPMECGGQRKSSAVCARKRQR